MIYTCQNSIYKLKYITYVDIVCQNDLKPLGFGGEWMRKKAWEKIVKEINELYQTSEAEYRQELEARLKKIENKALGIYMAAEVLRLSECMNPNAVKILIKLRVCLGTETKERMLSLAESIIKGLTINAEELKTQLKTEENTAKKIDYLKELSVISTEIPINMNDTVAEVIVAKNTFIELNKARKHGNDDN